MSVRLKRAALPELLAQDIEGKLSKAFAVQSLALGNEKYKLQLSARKLHFFYLEARHRGALLQRGKQFLVHGSRVSFSDKQALLRAVEQQPECFSPSAALRPLYQESVLPGIAYVAGPSELSYWLQLGGLFREAKLPMPVLLPRFFGALVPAAEQRKCQKLGLSWPDLFLPTKALHTKLLPKLKAYDISPSLKKMEEIFSELGKKVAALDSSLQQYVEKRNAQAAQSLHKISDKVRKHMIRKESTRNQQLQALQRLLKPEGLPQERRLNIAPFLLQQPMLLKQLTEEMDPFDFSFHLALL